MTILGRLIPDSDNLFDVEVADRRDLTAYEPQTYGVAPIFVFEPERVGYLTYGRQALVLSDDQQSLITWIRKALATPRGVYPIYDADYGTDLASGRLSYSELSGTLEDDLKRCLLLHPLITDVTDISVSQVGVDSMLLSLTAVDAISGGLTLTVAI